MAKPRERILELLTIAGAAGATGPQIIRTCNLWSGWGYVHLAQFENCGLVVSAFENSPHPRNRRYWLARMKGQ
jgi:hypothetical protein